MATSWTRRYVSEHEKKDLDGIYGHLRISSRLQKQTVSCTVEPRYLELAHFELPLISKWNLVPVFNMTIGNKIMWKRGEIAPPLFHIIIYIYFSNFRSQITYSLVVQFIVFLTLSTLICRGTDISKYFSESLGIRDNGCRLYMFTYDIRALFCGIIYMRRKRQMTRNVGKGNYAICEQRRFRWASASVQPGLDILCSSTHTTVSFIL